MATLDLLALNAAMKILVLEDDPEDFLLLSRLMGQFPGLKAEAMRASGFEEGLIMLRESYFDAVLVDYFLGAHDGLEFIAEARAQGVRCPMILLTGQSGGDVDLEALRLGAADYLHKGGLSAPLLERSLRYALERQRAQEALRRSDEYYRNIIDNSQDLITIIDERSVIRFESPSVRQLLGYDSGERIGQELFPFVHPQDVEEAKKRLALALKHNTGEGEYRMRHKDGSWRSMEFKAKNLLQLSGLRGVLFNSRDITERRRGIETLLKMERLAFLGQMTAGMAHEIRNPLAIIRMSAEMVREAGDSGPESKRHAEVMVGECDRLLRVMSETLDFSKNRPSTLVEVEPRELLEHSLKLARIQFGSAHEKVRFSWLDSDGAQPLMVDRQKAELVLVNLILNAYQAIPAGGELRLGWLGAGDGVQFVVEDTGPGMSEQDLDRIFDPFFTTKQQGSGLGLWLCQRMVEASGGRLGVQSGLGRGSRFTVWLPFQGGGAPA